MTNQSQEPDRGTPAPPKPTAPKSPAPETPLQQHAPPEAKSSAELIGEDEESPRPEGDLEDGATGDEPR